MVKQPIISSDRGKKEEMYFLAKESDKFLVGLGFGTIP